MLSREIITAAWTDPSGVGFQILGEEIASPIVALLQHEGLAKQEGILLRSAAVHIAWPEEVVPDFSEIDKAQSFLLDQIKAKINPLQQEALLLGPPSIRTEALRTMLKRWWIFKFDVGLAPLTKISMS